MASRNKPGQKPTGAAGGRTDHDALYHRLFSHPGVVAQLLRGFVDIDLADFDLDGMKRLNAKFHAKTGQRREGDMIWRIPRAAGDDAYLMLLLEFQSSSDEYMAVRVLTYAGLLWQQLVSEGRPVAPGKLPPILPVVVYNGDTRWGASLVLRTLIGLPEASPLWQWQPDMRYHLIDAGGFSAAELARRDGLPALWFRLEAADDPVQVLAVADALLTWLATHPGFAAARAVFAELMRATMVPMSPELRVPEDLLEVRNMLATRAERWMERWMLEGMEKGLLEGQQKGLQEGRQKGLQEGLEQGLQEGLEKGRHEGLEKGLQEGRATLLLRQLGHRFGALPEWVEGRVLTADTAELETFAMRIFDAKSVDDMFAEPRA